MHISLSIRAIIAPLHSPDPHEINRFPVSTKVRVCFFFRVYMGKEKLSLGKTIVPHQINGSKRMDAAM